MSKRKNNSIERRDKLLAKNKEKAARMMDSVRKLSNLLALDKRDELDGTIHETIGEKKVRADLAGIQMGPRGPMTSQEAAKITCRECKGDHRIIERKQLNNGCWTFFCIRCKRQWSQRPLSLLKILNCGHAGKARKLARQIYRLYAKHGKPYSDAMTYALTSTSNEKTATRAVNLAYGVNDELVIRSVVSGGRVSPR